MVFSGEDKRGTDIIGRYLISFRKRSQEKILRGVLASSNSRAGSGRSTVARLDATVLEDL
jgi:hypothetical protein